MSHATRILVVEDEPGIALAIYTSLSRADYRVDTAKTGSSGLRKAAVIAFDAVILDLGLPDMSGLAICKQLRKDGLLAPIIILTGEDAVRSKVSLLDAGANDYLTKPFSLEELHARLRVCLGHIPKQVPPKHLQVGELVLNGTNRTVERAGKTIQLRRKEFAILECLMQYPGGVVTRSKLINYAWDGNEDGWTNTVDVHIKYLRDKIDRPFTTPLITTVHGLGYKLEQPAKSAKIA